MPANANNGSVLQSRQDLIWFAGAIAVTHVTPAGVARHGGGSALRQILQAEVGYANNANRFANFL